ncbi:MAG: YceI family protein [Polyangiaceae bacterium]
MSRAPRTQATTGWLGPIACGALLSASCAAAPTPSPATPAGAQTKPRSLATLARYCVVRDASSLVASAYALGTRHPISVPAVTGRAWVSRRGQLPERVELDVDVSSARARSEWLTRLARSARFLDVRTHPKARFVGRAIAGHDGVLQLDGVLTLRGISRPLRVDVRGRRAAAELRAEAAFELNRHDFGLEPGIPYEWVLSDAVGVELRVVLHPC